MSFPLRDLDNPLIKKGMMAQLAKRRARIAAGEKSLGWKLGFGAPATMQKLGLAAPLVGYLMQRALLPSGGIVSFKTYLRPVAEPEIFVRMAHDLPGGISPAAALAAVQEIGPAIEVADLDPLPTPDNIDAVLADDIYHRHVILCGNTRPGADVSGLTSRLTRRGAEAARSTDPETLTGKLTAIVTHVANTLAAFGEKLAAGDVIITGSIIPPPIIEPDETELTHAIDPIGEVSVKFTRE